MYMVLGAGVNQYLILTTACNKVYEKKSNDWHSAVCLVHFWYKNEIHPFADFSAEY